MAANTTVELHKKVQAVGIALPRCGPGFSKPDPSAQKEEREEIIIASIHQQLSVNAAAAGVNKHMHTHTHTSIYIYILPPIPRSQYKIERSLANKF